MALSRRARSAVAALAHIAEYVWQPLAFRLSGRRMRRACGFLVR